MTSQPINLNRFEAMEKPPFPIPGSVIGRDRRYFCLGTLGKGTFCGIHKCVDLSYSHLVKLAMTPTLNEGPNAKIQYFFGKPNNKVRVVAAKVELSNFFNSGVVDSEAMVLFYLSSHLETGDSVPLFIEFIKGANLNGTTPSSSNGDTSSSGRMSAIIMEYLAGEDMHNIRDYHCQDVLAAKQSNMIASPAQDPQVPPSILSNERRLSIPDAIYLCADVLLPMIRNLHRMGIIHRDVKPSNCVRVKGTRDFRLIDFGLSKSFIVPQESLMADKSKPWPSNWMGAFFNTRKPLREPKTQQNPPPSTTNVSDTSSRVYSSVGYFSKERPKADFRGTSMYASLRVHQERDYGRRDDIWSLIYVFCDFVAGGLPWMTFAAAKDRKMCLVLKEWIHGERKSWEEDCQEVKDVHESSTVDSYSDHLDELLKGADYHTCKFKPSKVTTVKTDEDRTKVKTNDEDANAKTNDNDEDANEKMDEVETKTEIVDKGINTKVEVDDKSTNTKGEMDDKANVKDTNVETSDEHLSDPKADVMPSPLSQDPLKVECLRTIFRHLSQLGFADEPDYDLVCTNLKRFGESSEGSEANSHESFPSIPWEKLNDKPESSIKKEGRTTDDAKVVDLDPLEDVIRNDTDVNGDVVHTIIMNGESEKNANKLSSDAVDLNQLPLALQLRLAQVEYNACNPSTIPIHLALRDWLALASSLLHDPWDSAKYERREYQTRDSGYRREVFVKLLTQCRDAARPFGNFRSPDAFYFMDGNQNTEEFHQLKKRKLFRHSPVSDGTSTLAVFHELFFLLERTIETEYEKKTPVPLALSF